MKNQNTCQYCWFYVIQSQLSSITVINERRCSKIYCTLVFTYYLCDINGTCTCWEYSDFYHVHCKTASVHRFVTQFFLRILAWPMTNSSIKITFQNPVYSTGIQYDLSIKNVNQCQQCSTCIMHVWRPRRLCFHEISDY